VEICCHGGILVTEAVLGAILAAGATPAGAGEFTKRAFLNGRLSLSEAEAIADVLDAHSTEALRLSGANARGALARKLDHIYNRLQTVVASCYVDSDFPGEDLSDMTEDDMLSCYRALRDEIDTLSATYRMGKAVCEGIDTVIVGKPNAGKSSLLNMMCESERAIVTDIAGTTRDLLEERVVIGRVTLNLCDTAGIRNTRAKVEKIGVERAEERMESAELILAVFDASSPLDRYDARVIERLRHIPATKIALINKNDLQRQMDPYQLGELFHRVIYISCATGEGKDELYKTVEDMYTAGQINYDTTATVTGARVYAALRGASESLGRAIEALSGGTAPDIAAMEAEIALSRLGEADGRRVAEGIVDEIFHRFCVGK
jgi:tRNA modification GTPase